MNDGVVHRAMRLHVGDGRTIGLRQCLQSANLVRDFVCEFRRVVINKTAAEGCRIVIAHVRADCHTSLRGRLECARDGVRVTRMETGGYVGGRDKLEHGRIVGDGVARGGLAEVGVEVYVQRAHDSPYIPNC